MPKSSTLTSPWNSVWPMVSPPGVPIASTSLTVLQHDHGRVVEQRNLTRTHVVDVVRIRRRRAEPQAVVEQQSGVTDDDAGAHPAADGRRHGDGVADAIDDREARRLGIGLVALGPCRHRGPPRDRRAPQSRGHAPAAARWSSSQTPQGLPASGYATACAGSISLRRSAAKPFESKPCTRAPS